MSGPKPEEYDADKPCSGCGEIISKYYPDGTRRVKKVYEKMKYCSLKCRNPQSREEYIADKPCECCGKFISEFQPSGKRRIKKSYEKLKYCSNKCYYAMKREEYVADKLCETCGKTISEFRSNGKRIKKIQYEEMKYCCHPCSCEAASIRAKEKREKKYKDYENTKRDKRAARKHLKDYCESCGNIKDLHAHHIDQNYKNNSAENIQTLCENCHMFWTGTAKRAGREIAGRMPILLPESIPKAINKQDIAHQGRTGPRMSCFY